MTTITNEEIWEIKLEAVKTYIDRNNKWPSPSDKNLHVKLLGLWILDQTQEYGLLRDRGDKYPSHIMANPLIMDKWVKFSDNSRYDCSTDYTPLDQETPVKKIEISQEMLLNIAEMHKQCIQTQECEESSDDVKAVGEWLSNNGC
jgi:hypothetical protein